MKTTSRSSKLTRRHFIALTGMAAAAPTIIPASALGRGGATAPSNRITMGVVGWGMQGPGNTQAFMSHADCQVVAACNIDKNHLQRSLDTINGHYKNKDCKAYHDYREMMARKDIYGEKPLARTIAEQQAIVKEVKKLDLIWQTGSWQRSERHFHYACEIVRNGLIGKIQRVEVGLPAGHHDFAGTGKPLMEKLAQAGKPNDLSKLVPGGSGWDLAVTEPPAELDYKTWIGPSKMEPYVQARGHMNWRWNYNTGGGQLLDWIGHHCDIGHWGLGNDDKIGPLEVEGQGEFPSPDALWNTCMKYRITCKYPDDIEMILAGGHGDIEGGTKWIGTDGWVWVNRGNAFKSSNKTWEDTRSLPDAERKVKLHLTAGANPHYRNFLDSVKSRKPTVAPVEVAHHSAIPGHLGLIAMLVGKKIKWDASKEVIVGDAEASKLLNRPFRSPWKLA